MYIPQCCFKTGYYKNSGALAITICRRTTLGVLPVIPLTINLGPMKNHCTAIKDITSPDYKLTKQMQQIMHPRAVLVAYECETTDYSTPRSYLELRPVNEKGRMGAGIPVTYEFMNSLVESYTESMSGIPHGRIPGNMLLCDSRKGRERYIWYNPPQKRKMYFQDGLHITDGTFNVS